jgi:hypothetical protein
MPIGGEVDNATLYPRWPAVRGPPLGWHR